MEGWEGPHYKCQYTFISKLCCKPPSPLLPPRKKQQEEGRGRRPGVCRGGIPGPGAAGPRVCLSAGICTCTVPVARATAAQAACTKHFSGKIQLLSCRRCGWLFYCGLSLCCHCTVHAVPVGYRKRTHNIMSPCGRCRRSRATNNNPVGRGRASTPGAATPHSSIARRMNGPRGVPARQPRPE